MAKGNNQKLKMVYLMKILLEKTDETHSITMSEIFSSLEAYVFFASPFWTKLQNIFGHCCMSKLDKVAKHMASLEQTSRTALQTL